MKVLVAEEGSAPVRSLFDGSDRLVSSRLLAVELTAAAQRRGLPAANVDEVLASVSLISVNDEVLDDAMRLRSGLRSLDALHLATALLIASDLAGFLAFDKDL